MKKEIILIGIMGILFIGCSGKTQINPNSVNEQIFTQEEMSFDNQKILDKKLSQSYEQGDMDGYGRAKKEFEQLIPYLEAIRASAELKHSGGLCLPPLYIDRTKGNVATSLGEAHICENFTVENVLRAVKSGVPNLPATQSGTKQITTENIDTFMPTNVSIAGLKEENHFIETVKPVVQAKIAKIVGSIANRNILRESDGNYSNIEMDSENYLNITFDDETSRENFCSKYKICEKG